MPLSFENPSALAWLLLSAPLVAVHLYRGRARRWSVPFLPLWEAVLRADEARAGLTSLRRWISLALALGALVAGTGALARPRRGDPLRSPPAAVILLDVTRSLGAAPAGGASVFDRAREDCRRLFDGAEPDAAFAVIPVGRGAGTGTPLTSDREILRRFLDGLSPDFRDADWTGAAALAADLLRGRPDGRILMITDGARVAAVPARIEGFPLFVHLVGLRDPANRGFIDGVLHRPWGSKNAKIILKISSSRFQVPGSKLLIPGSIDPAGANMERGTWNVELRVDGRVVRTQEVPSGAAEVSIDVPLDGPEEARVLVQFRSADAFPADDAAYFIAPGRERARMIVVRAGETPLFLARAAAVLAAHYDADASFGIPPAEFPAQAPRLRDRDVIIADGVVPDVLPPHGRLAVFADEAGALPRRGRPDGPLLEAPSAVYPADDDPLLDLADLRPLRLRRARGIVPLPGERVLLAASQEAVGRSQEPETRNQEPETRNQKPDTEVPVPIAVAGREGDLAYVLFGFRLDDSNLGLLPSFPILLRNLATAGADDADRRFPRQGRAGEPLAARRATAPDAVLRVVRTDGLGAEESWEVPSGGGWPAVARTEEPGFYRIDGPGLVETCAVNLFDPAESELAPPPGFVLPAAQVLRLPDPLPWPRRLPPEWPWAAAMVLCLGLEVMLSVRGWV